MSAGALKVALSPEVESIRDFLVEVRRDLHQHPELAFEEHRTSQVITRHLDRFNISYRSGVAGTGVIGLIEGQKPGPTLLLRADMDALPIHEETDLPYASVYPGKMHACGHDAHTAILLGVAALLNKKREALAGKVKLMFQPAEEGPGGALPMIQEGLLEEPSVDAAVALHVWSTLPLGQVRSAYGAMMACADRFVIKVRGEGGHAALPHNCVDPVLAAAHLICALQSLVSRNVDPKESLVLSVTSVQGGTAHNIIPPEVELKGTVRALDEQVRSLARKRLEELVVQVPKAFGASGSLDYMEGYPVLYNDPAVVDMVREASAEILGDVGCFGEYRCLGGEDMAYVLREVPGCLFFVGAGNPAKGCCYGHHHPKFAIDEDVLPIGVELLLRVVDLFGERWE